MYDKTCKNTMASNFAYVDIDRITADVMQVGTLQSNNGPTAIHLPENGGIVFAFQDCNDVAFMPSSILLANGVVVQCTELSSTAPGIGFRMDSSANTTSSYFLTVGDNTTTHISSLEGHEFVSSNSDVRLQIQNAESNVVISSFNSAGHVMDMCLNGASVKIPTANLIVSNIFVVTKDTISIGDSNSDTYFNGKTNVNGSFCIGSAFSTDADANTVTLGGSTQVQGTLGVGSVFVADADANTVTLGGSAQVHGSLSVGSLFSVNPLTHDIVINGAYFGGSNCVSLAGNTNIAGKLVASNNIDVRGSTILRGTVIALNQVSANSLSSQTDCNVLGNLVTSNAFVSNTLGASNIQTANTVTQNLLVTGNATIASISYTGSVKTPLLCVTNGIASANLMLLGNVLTSSSVALTGNLAVNGTATIGNIACQGLSTVHYISASSCLLGGGVQDNAKVLQVTGNVSISNSCNVGNALSACTMTVGLGIPDMAKKLNVFGSSNFNGNINVTGNIVTGNIASPSDSLCFNANIIYFNANQV